MFASRVPLGGNYIVEVYMERSRKTFSLESLLEGYGAIFSAKMRAAHIALLLYAREHCPDGWPTVLAAEKIAKLFKVPLTDLCAFFGHLSYREGRRTLWFDTRRSDKSGWLFRQNASREQALALGMMNMLMEAIWKEIESEAMTDGDALLDLFRNTACH